MKRTHTRLLAVLLIAALLLSLLPVFCAAGNDIILPPDEFDDPDPLDGFTDVKKGTWYYNAVKYMVEKGYMGSTSTKAKTFEPTKTLTRAEFVMVLYNILGGKPVSISNPFTDVKGGKWYYDAVLWAYKEGLTSGTSATTFAPNASVTREQVAQFLYNAFGTGNAADRLSAFVDGSSVSKWARTAMNWAIEKSIISGTDKSELKPLGNATRAELASILYRLLNR